MKRLFNYIPYVAFLLVFIGEGLGVLTPRESIIGLVCASIFFTVSLLRRKHIVIPQVFGYGYIIFITIVCGLLPFAIYPDGHILQLLNYLSIGLICVEIYNRKDAGRLLLQGFLIVTGLLSMVSLLFLWSPFMLSWRPVIGEQFIFAVFGHNNIGHLASAASLVSLYFFFHNRQKKWLLLSISFFIVLMLSFARSAYVAFIITLFFVISSYAAQIESKKPFTIFGSFVVIVILSFFAITFFPTLDQKNSFDNNMRSIVDVPYKDIAAERPLYWSIAWQSITEHPLTGVGGEGYRYSFLKYSNKLSSYSTSAHNVVLDSLVQYGLVCGSVITFIIILIAVSAFNRLAKKIRNNSVSSVAISIILISFFISTFFDAVYTIPVFLALYLMLGMCIYDEKKTLVLSVHKSALVAISVVSIFIAFQYVFSREMEKRKQYELAIITFPFSPSAFEKAIDQSLAERDGKKVENRAQWYGRIHRNNPDAILFLGDTYAYLKQYKQAEMYYDRYLRNIYVPSEGDAKFKKE